MDLTRIIDSDSHNRPTYGSVNVDGQGYAVVGDVHFHGGSALRELEHDAAERRELLAALAYENMSSRRRQLAEHTPASLSWIWRRVPDAASGFADWLTSDSPKFWITGKPGSGKSTLVKYISEHEKCLQLLQEKSRSSWMLVNFYFDYRAGSTIPNSLEGLLRSVLYQIVKNSHDAQRAIARNRMGQDLDPLDNDLDQGQLRRLIKLAITTVKSKSKLCAFLDGLDEYQKHHLEVIRMLDFLLASGVSKICVASRPEFILYEHLHNHPYLRMQEHNAPTIQAYVSSYLESTPSTHLGIDTARLIVRVVQAAEGVILWAELVSHHLVNNILSGESEDQILDLISEFPRELDEVYERLLNNVEPAHQLESALILQLIRTHPSNVTPWDIQSALAYLRDSGELPSWPSNELSYGLFLSRLRSRTSSMVDIVSGPTKLASKGSSFPVPFRAYEERSRSRCFHLRLFHKTLDHYLSTTNWAAQILCKSLANIPVDNIWLHLCTRMILANEVTFSDCQTIHRYLCMPISHTDWLSGQRSAERFPNKKAEFVAYSLAHSYSANSGMAFLDYALTNLHKHIILPDLTGQVDLTIKSVLLLLHPFKCWLRLFESSGSISCGPCLAIIRHRGFKDGFCPFSVSGTYRSNIYAISHGLFKLFTEYDAHALHARYPRAFEDLNWITFGGMIQWSRDSAETYYFERGILPLIPFLKAEDIAYQLIANPLPLTHTLKVCQALMPSIRHMGGALTLYTSKYDNRLHDDSGVSESTYKIRLPFSDNDAVMKHGIDITLFFIWQLIPKAGVPSQDDLKILEALLPLGPGINASCSIFGPLLHSMLSSFGPFGTWSVEANCVPKFVTLMQVILSAGARLDVYGPHGNVVSTIEAETDKWSSGRYANLGKRHEVAVKVLNALKGKIEELVDVV